MAQDVALRIADGVLPPTNRWYSSLAFAEPGLPVFPKPLAVTPVDGGFTLGLTNPTASERAIMAPATADVSVSITGASGYGLVVHADPVAVGVRWADAVVTLAQGWPVAGVTADAAVELRLGVPFAPVAEGVAEATVGAVTYGVRVDDGVLDGTSVQLREGGSAQFFAVPSGGDTVAFARALGEPVTAVGWEGSADDGAATTTLTYADATVLTMPAQRAADAGLDCDLGTYPTIDGEFAVCAAGEVTWSVPAVDPSGELDLSDITEDQRSRIAEAVVADVAALGALPSDSYFGGKALYRLVNLVLLAEQVGDTDAAVAARGVLETSLREWGDAERCATGEPRCFVYEPVIRGVVGVTPAFGSEDFNDHHFHYGYLLHAAAVAAASDEDLAAAIGPVFDQVAADIASGDAAADFPPIRHFDPAAGHSWASGFSPFADGNNQESSSEAVTAWNSVALWAQVRGDAALEQRARWMLAAEADAARRLWLAPNLDAFPEYDHTIVAMEWGGKRDYATWFSPEPSAMLGIQLIPVAPFAAEYLAAVGPERITASVAEAAPHGVEVQFGDYLLMYSALAGEDERAAAWEVALTLPDSAIDDGNSRAYLLAWLASLV